MELRRAEKSEEPYSHHIWHFLSVRAAINRFGRPEGKYVSLVQLEAMSTAFLKFAAVRGPLLGREIAAYDWMLVAFEHPRIKADFLRMGEEASEYYLRLQARLVELFDRTPVIPISPSEPNGAIPRLHREKLPRVGKRNPGNFSPKLRPFAGVRIPRCRRPMPMSWWKASSSASTRWTPCAGSFPLFAARTRLQRARSHRPPTGSISWSGILRSLPGGSGTAGSAERGRDFRQHGVVYRPDGHGGGLNHLKPHEYAGIFPFRDDADLTALSDNMHANGQRQAIVLFEGQILDGRRRYAAGLRAGVKLRFRQFGSDEGDGDDPLDYACDVNMHARQLTRAERDLAAAAYATCKKGRPPVNPTKVGFTPKVTQRQAAEKFGVNPKQIERINKVQENGVPELVAA